MRGGAAADRLTEYDPVLSAEKAAEYLGGISTRQLLRLDITRTAIPGTGKRVRYGYRLSALNAWLAAANDPQSRAPLVRVVPVVPIEQGG